MSSVFGQYIEHVKSLIAKIIENANPEDIIRIVDFSNDVHFKEFKLSDSNNIFEHLKTLKSDANTNLYGAVYHELTALPQYPGYSPCMVVFTDGAQNHGPVTEGQLTDLLGRKLREPGHYQPKVFSLMLGQSCDRKLFTWSDQTGVPVTALNKIDDFINIFAHLGKMRRPRLLARIAQGIVQNCFSVYENTLVIAPLKLNPEESFKYGEKEYVYRPSDSLEEDEVEEFREDLEGLSLGGAPTFAPSFDSQQEKKPDSAQQSSNRSGWSCTIS